MRFNPGQSGNPKGRPVGIKNRPSLLKEMLDPHAPEIVQKLVDLARDGDINVYRT